MKKTLPLAVACALLAASAAARAQTTPPAKTPDAGPRPVVTPADKPPPPKFIPDEVFNRELKDLDGRSFFLSNFRGQVLVLNLWASWCGPCHYEMPELNKLREEFAPRGVALVGLTLEDPEVDGEKVRAYVEKLKISYALAWADRDDAKTLMDDRPNLPQTFVVAPDGRVVTRFVGFAPDKSPSLLRDAVRRALGDIE